MKTDYKKKYEEALEKARERNGTLAAGRDFFAEIFPELAESEDERIIEALIAHLTVYEKNTVTINCVPVQDILAWLEEQKESLHISETCKENADSFTDEDERVRKELLEVIRHCYEDGGYALCTDDYKKYSAYLEKQKEQKPICKTEPIVDGLTEFEKQVSYLIASAMDKEHEYSEGYVKWVSQSLLEYAKKESVKESDEDERIRQSIIKDIEFERNFTLATTDKVIGDKVIGKYNEQINWLKSIPLNLKKKNEDVAKLCSNEWSKEDEDFINMLILHFNYLIDKGGDSVETYKSYIEKLKSFHPQPHTVSIKDATKFGNLEYERGVKDGIQHAKNHQWKPSEEQIMALDTYRKVPCSGSIDRKVLDSLYNSLEKMM